MSTAPREPAESADQHLASMYAVLGATNEALLYAATPGELYQRVCDAAVEGRKFLTAALTTPDPQTGWLAVEAASGTGAQQLRATHISVDASTVEGRWLVGEAYRSGRPPQQRFHEHERTPVVQVALPAGVAAVPPSPSFAVAAIGVSVLCAETYHSGRHHRAARLMQQHVFASATSSARPSAAQRDRVAHSEEHFAHPDAWATPIRCRRPGQPVYHPAFSRCGPD